MIIRRKLDIKVPILTILKLLDIIIIKIALKFSKKKGDLSPDKKIKISLARRKKINFFFEFFGFKKMIKPIRIGINLDKYVPSTFSSINNPPIL